MASGKKITQETVIPWGAHKTKKLIQLPIDYLQYCIVRWDKDPTSKEQFQNWYNAFKEEIGRRSQMHAQAQTEGLKIDEDLVPEERMQFLSAVGEIDLDDDEADMVPPQQRKGTGAIPITGKPTPKTQVRIAAKKAAYNDASLLLLKEFIMRGDKTQGIVDWVVGLAIDAPRYGEVLTQKPGKLIVYYLNLFFHYDTSDPKVMTLTRIWEKKP